ncbi:12948_t:CDS:2, partial [Ambispora leptoticha]
MTEKKSENKSHDQSFVTNSGHFDDSTSSNKKKLDFTEKNIIMQ